MAPSVVSPPPSTSMSSTSVSSPIKPKSILSQKRSSVANNDSQPVSTKRVRVAFEPDLGESDSADEDAAILREELVYALAHRDDTGAEKYGEIKDVFSQPLDSDDAVPAKRIKAHLVALINNAPSLKRSYADLVHCVLRHHWLGRDDSLTSLFTRFLGHLISSHPGYQYSVLKMLVENFAHVSSSAGRYPNLSLASRETMQSRIHHALRYLLHLVPSASSTLAVIVSQCFPFTTDTQNAHIHYVRNLLRLTEYAPELRTVTLDLIIERLLKIDVQVQVDVEELQEEAEDYLMAGQAAIPAAPGLDDLSDAESDLSDDDGDDVDPEEQRFRALKVCVEKMDAILDLLFEYHQPIIARSNHADSFSTFNHLLSQFNKSILPTYQSRHTQFLLFHFAQASPEFVLSYVDACIHILTDRTRSNVLRVSAAAYVATFTARGVHVEADMVLHVFNTLARYSDQLRENHEPNCRGPALRKYSPYYSTVQALLYIFCFRWRDLLAPASQPSDDDATDSEVDEYDDVPSTRLLNNRTRKPRPTDDALDVALFDGTRPLVFLPLVKDAFARNFSSRLNPLKVCAPEIVNEFAKIAHHLSFMYIYAILEANKRVRLTHSHVATTPSSYSGGSTTKPSVAIPRHHNHRDLGTTSASTSPATTPSASAPATPPATPSTKRPTEPGFDGAAVTSNVSLGRRETSLNALRGERFCQLDAYFPFDPYRLPVSKRWVVDEYREWRGVPGLREKEEQSAVQQSSGRSAGLTGENDEEGAGGGSEDEEEDDDDDGDNENESGDEESDEEMNDKSDEDEEDDGKNAD